MTRPDGEWLSLEKKTMTKSTKTVLFWTPRVLTLLFAVFVSMFALDVFGEGLGFWQTIGALLLHLIPTAALLVFLAITWRRAWVGALVYAALGVLYIVLFRGRFPWTVYAVIAGPLFMISALFLVDWLHRDELGTAS